MKTLKILGHDSRNGNVTLTPLNGNGIDASA